MKIPSRQELPKKAVNNNFHYLIDRMPTGTEHLKEKFYSKISVEPTAITTYVRPNGLMNISTSE
jgi:hypothetical protein